MDNLTETPIEDLSKIIITNWYKLNIYYKEKNDKENLDYLSKWLIEEAEPFMREVAQDYELKYNRHKKLKLRKYVTKYNQFFEYIAKEEDEKYKNDRLFKALIQVPSEVEDLIEDKRK